MNRAPLALPHVVVDSAADVVSLRLANVDGICDGMRTAFRYPAYSDQAFPARLNIIAPVRGGDAVVGITAGTLVTG